MPHSKLRSLHLKQEQLDPLTDTYPADPTFEASLNAHGMYETTRFVLRLSPRNHELMETIEKQTFDNGVPPEVIQAYSTYIHETVHWWQHVGSTSGLLFSLSYLAQVHSNIEELKDVLANIGAKKPLKGYTDQVLLREGEEAQAKLAAANVAVNNAIDVEFYKAYAYSPRENIKWIAEATHFEAVGYNYAVVYGLLVGMIAHAIDPEFRALPNISKWDAEIERLNATQHEGFYHGSPIRLPVTGMRAIYEGQARFIQLQFLSNTQDPPLSYTMLRDDGLLHGIYIEAFEHFLQLSSSQCPETMNDPLIGLFLLVCDIAINPTRGMPLDVECFEDLILDVDIGVRFTKLCLAIQQLPHLRTTIAEYSKEEYLAVAAQLVDAAGYDHPITGLAAVVKWMEDAPGLIDLMEEHRTFNFKPVNLPVRVFLSHFVAFCRDKIEHPEFFCWPGCYMAGPKHKAEARDIWLRHLSLFSDRGDKEGVYPRKWPNRSDDAVQETFRRFYGSMALYDLTRQWLLKDGPFVFNFQWVSEKHNQATAEAWGNDSFMQAYGVNLSDFEIVQ